GIISPMITGFEIAQMIMAMTAGTVFLMWLGELITERHIGNGISIMIFAGIIAQLPTQISQAFVNFDNSQVMNWIAYAVIGILTVAGIVFITEGQRNIPVVYAKRMRG